MTIFICYQNSNWKNYIICVVWIKSHKFFVQNRFNKKGQSEKKLDIGFGATTEINDLLKKDTVTDESLKSFKKDCITFISSMLTKLLERSPLICSSTKFFLDLTTSDSYKTWLIQNIFQKLSWKNSPNEQNKDKWYRQSPSWVHKISLFHCASKPNTF